MAAVWPNAWSDALFSMFVRPRGRNDWYALVRNTESGALLLFLLVLPLLESPKTMTLVAFVVVAAIRLAMEGRLWRWPDAIETTVLAFLVVCIIGSIRAAVIDTSGQPLGKFRELHYVVEGCLLFVLVHRAGYTAQQRLLMLALLIVSMVPAAVRGEIAVMQGRSSDPYLAAIGAAGASAVYVAMMIGVAAGFLLGAWRDLGPKTRVALFLFIAASLGLILDMLSRAGLFAVIVLMAVMFLLRRSWRTLILFVAVLLGLGAWTLLAVPDLAHRFVIMDLDSLKSALGPRWEYERVSIAAGLQNPLFGIGSGNYNRQDFASYGLDLDEQSGIFGAGQSHSLLLGRLAEQGFLGLAAIVGFLALSGVALWRNRNLPEGPARVLWYAGLSAWVVMMANGLFLDTFERELGQFTFLLIALALAPLPQASVAAPPLSRSSIVSAASSLPR